MIAPKERKVRIHVGYGLEGALTDVAASRIIRFEIVPRFRTGDFAGGVTAGVEAILKTIAGEYRAPEQAERASGASGPIPQILLAVFVGTIAGLVLSRSESLGRIGGRQRRYLTHGRALARSGWNCGRGDVLVDVAGERGHELLRVSSKG
ncbi:MAG: TPM domain-containing protein [Nitrospiraceae bacterium]